MSLSRLIPADEALRIVLDGVSACGSEEVPLAQAAGRTVCRDLEARRTQPPFDASAMDGYAVRQADILSLPATLDVIGQSRAGMPFGSSLGAQHAVRIFTGAVVPPGADSIIVQENTQATDDGCVRILKGVEPGRFIRPAGLDFTCGEVLVKAGELLGPSRLALAASMNHAKVPVFKKPRVALITTGDELVMPGGETGAGQIIASNTFGLMASIENCGGVVLDCGIVEDRHEALETAFEQAIRSGADLIVTTGGASVGDHDLVLPVAQKTGFDFQISKIAMRPGKPFLFGTRSYEDRTIYFTGLAGNPVSSLVAFNVFVKPLIELLCGRPASSIRMKQAILGCDLPANDERAEFMRADLHVSESGSTIATPYKSQDSSMLRLLAGAKCLVFRDVKAPAAKTGDTVQIVVIAGSGAF